METEKPHIAILASPGMGHLIPMVELGNRLLTHHNFHVTIFVVTTDSSTTSSYILQNTPNLNILVLPPVDVSGKLGLNPLLGEKIELTLSESLPFLRSSIESMKLPPSSLIVDMFGTLAFPMARDLGMSTYVFFATSAWLTALTLYLSIIDEKLLEKHANDHEPLLIPGCKLVRFEDTVEPLLTLGGPIYEGYLKIAKDSVSADGVLVNTWQDLEPMEIKALQEQEILGRFIKGPIYPIGPLVRSDVEWKGEKKVLQWLDGQPAESVIYVSFGSGGTMSEGQMREVAWGLELSQQRFVWVVRPPKEGIASGSFFDVSDDRDGARDYLPEGFVRRTKEVGMVVPMWAPQAEILGHRSTGGFVTHCGWNSVLEGILNGVPMVAWPLYAEQKMNASMLSEELGVAARVKPAKEEGGVVCREQIAELVRKVMITKEGIAMRAKIKGLKLSGEKAVSLFGSSYLSLSQMLKDCALPLQGGSDVKS